MKCTKVDWGNEKVNFKMAGKDGTAIILIHGIPSSLDEWKFLFPELVSSGYRPISLDLLGHGSSYKPGNPFCYTTDVAYDFFEEWVKSLKLDSPCVLIGHSFGGHLSIKYAFNNPGKVRALILIDPFLSYAQTSPMIRFFLLNSAFAAFLFKLTPSWLVKLFVWLVSLRIEKFHLLSSLSRDELTNMANDYKRCSPNVVYFPRSVSDKGIDYAEIKLPILLIWGKKDFTLSPKGYKEIAFKLPKCTYYVLNAGHFPHRTNYHQVNALILEFLKNNSI
jgi:pimeloyl-ACP methyl ester carboxylesterase